MALVIAKALAQTPTAARAPATGRIYVFRNFSIISLVPKRNACFRALGWRPACVAPLPLYCDGGYAAAIAAASCAPLTQLPWSTMPSNRQLVPFCTFVHRL